jgi:hypothetical protein
MPSSVLELEDSINLCSYVRADPVNYTDPTGLESMKTCTARQAAERASGAKEVSVCGGGGDGGGGGFGGFGRGWSWGDGSGGGGFSGGRSEGPSIPHPHEYEFQREVTKDDTRCSGTQVNDALARFAVPGNDNTKVQSGRNYTVLAGFLRIGEVAVRIRNGGSSITNQTLDCHLFQKGSVNLSTFERGRGGYSVQVRGEGMNTGTEFALANQIFGPMAFKNQVAKVKNYLKKTCGG